MKQNEQFRTAISVGLIVIAYLLWPGDATAEDFSYNLNVLVASKHFDDGDYNEQNPGLGVQANLPSGLGVGVLHYLNSHNKMSTYFYLAGYGYKNRYLKLGGQIGYVTGYEKDELEIPIVPMLNAVITVAPGSPAIPNIFISGLPIDDGFVATGLSWSF